MESKSVPGQMESKIVPGQIESKIVPKQMESKIVPRQMESKSVPLSSLDDDITIKDIKILQKLGSGNFGEVYKGKWENVDVALKKLKDEQVESANKEATLLRNLRHPNIVQYFGLFVDDEQVCYIVLEYFPLGSLDRLLQAASDSEINTTTLIDMASQITAGMIFLEKKTYYS